MDLKDVGYAAVDWINLAHNSDQCRRVVNTIMNIQVL
jgi:hypothetical protein